MKPKKPQSPRFLFATTPLPCPYLPDRVERRVVTELQRGDDKAVQDALFQAGFRRSHGIAYMPACPDCSACVPVRAVVDGFQRTRSQRRVWKRNQEVRACELPPQASTEQYDLFAAYQESRHGDGDMAKMDFDDYKALVEDTPLETVMVEFRDPDGSLVGACLTDRLSDGLSAVYSFFTPEQNRRSLGTYMVLWLMERAKSIDFSYVYLGFWIADLNKMAYKTMFQPTEAYTPEGWRVMVSPDSEQR